jgi:hypothetical protein
VISLALILKNPAPTAIVSGALTQNHNPEETPALNQSEDKSSTANASTSNRAKYVSRGTLVVCNVSLVGQWIDEAKSKLKNPGLVYSYHGSKRKRCPNVLAQNAIVVTTYATLASDDTFWRSKSEKNGESDYCRKCMLIS